MLKTAYNLGVKLALMANQSQFTNYAGVPHNIGNLGGNPQDSYDPITGDKRRSAVELAFLQADRSVGFAEDRGGIAPAPGMNNS
jgi:hypothetical protein